MADTRKIQSLTARMGREATAAQKAVEKLGTTHKELQALTGQPPASGPRPGRGKTGASSAQAGQSGT